MDWLFKEDEYIPEGDRDTFLNKSIYSILNVLGKIKRTNSLYDAGFIYRINPVIKLFCTILLILFISISRNRTFIITSGVFLIFSLIMMENQGLLRVMTTSLTVGVFSLLIFTPSIFMGYGKNSIMVVAKIIISVGLAGVLSHTSRWHRVIAGLKVLFIPDIFIFVIDISIKYIYLLGEMSVDMLNALKLRTVGKNNNKYGSLSGIMGNLFIKSRDMAEEMYSAMECRGFTGEYKASIGSGFTLADFIYILFTAVAIIIFFL